MTPKPWVEYAAKVLEREQRREPPPTPDPLTHDFWFVIGKSPDVCMDCGQDQWAHIPAWIKYTT